MRKLVKDRDKLAIASAIWTDEWWYPDSSIDVNPPLVTSRSSTIPRQSQAIVVGKQALLTCLKYTKNPAKHSGQNCFKSFVSFLNGKCVFGVKSIFPSKIIERFPFESILRVF